MLRTGVALTGLGLAVLFVFWLIGVRLTGPSQSLAQVPNQPNAGTSDLENWRSHISVVTDHWLAEAPPLPKLNEPGLPRKELDRRITV
ncbi:MAG: hypothetical protein RMI91_04825 [Gemmatales bacterium]|nr:hypothetical protein [Gemmatales bacterium]MDW7993959.1 hypothetical protein [Gemmatales bacterium]